MLPNNRVSADPSKTFNAYLDALIKEIIGLASTIWCSPNRIFESFDDGEKVEVGVKARTSTMTGNALL
jgi:hypothetical protein